MRSNKPEVTTMNLQCLVDIFGFHIAHVSQGWTFPKEQHRAFEINHVLEGIQVKHVGGHDIQQRPGDLIVLNPGTIHSSSAPSPEGLTYLCFHFNLDDPLFRETLIRSNTTLYREDTVLAKRAATSLDHLAQLWSKREDGLDRIRLLAVLLDVLAGIGEGMTAQREDPEKTEFVSPGVALLAHRIAELLRLHAFQRQEDGSFLRGVKEAAEIASVSLSHCHRVFHHVYGISPKQYVSSLRLAEAKKLLLEPELSIEEVAFRIGFSSLSDFSRQFKRWTGQSPSLCRKTSIVRLYGENG